MKTLILSTDVNSRHIRPTNYTDSFNRLKMETLDEKEQAFHDALLKVENNDFWGLAIRNVFVDYTVKKFRQLVCELLSQNDDNPDMMYRILGKEAYDLLIKLKPVEKK